MWCIVIRDANGEHYREMEDEKPSNSNLSYWENRHKTYRIDPKAHYYDNSYSVDAVVVNVFEIADEVKNNDSGW